MSACSHIQRSVFPVSGRGRSGHRDAQYLQTPQNCADCAGEFAAWRKSQTLVSALGPRGSPRTSRSGFASPSRRRAAIPPASVSAASRAAGRTPSSRSCCAPPRASPAPSSWWVRRPCWSAPSPRPEPVEARDVPLQIATAPRLLYSSFQLADDIGDHNNPVVLQVFVDSRGRVYDYKVLSGQVDAQTRESIDSLLLFSVFAPARSW